MKHISREDLELQAELQSLKDQLAKNSRNSRVTKGTR
jgi:hypothetical protein